MSDAFLFILLSAYWHWRGGSLHDHCNRMGKRGAMTGELTYLEKLPQKRRPGRITRLVHCLWYAIGLPLRCVLR